MMATFYQILTPKVHMKLEMCWSFWPLSSFPENLMVSYAVPIIAARWLSEACNQSGLVPSQALMMSLYLALMTSMGKPYNILSGNFT